MGSAWHDPGAAVESDHHGRAGGRPSCVRLHPTTDPVTATVIRSSFCRSWWLDRAAGGDHVRSKWPTTLHGESLVRADTAGLEW